MQNEEIAKYVVDERARGVREEDIKAELLAKGWKEDDVNAAMATVASDTSPPATQFNGGLSDMGDLFLLTWTDMQSHFSLIASIMSVPIILYFAASVSREMMTRDDMFSSGILYAFAQLAGAIFLLLATIGIIKQVKSGWKLSVEETYRIALPYFWPLVWVSLLSGLVVLGGFLLLLVPGVILAVMLSFSRIAVVVDDKRGMDALMWSKELVHGLWWEVFKRLISLGLLLGVVSILLGIVPYIGSALSILTVPFSMMFVVRLYDELKALKGLVPGVTTHGRGMLVGAMVVGIVAIPLLFIAVAGLAMLGTYQNFRGPSGALPVMNGSYPVNTDTLGMPPVNPLPALK